MSTQHPDNAKVPEWATREVLEGEDEVEEAYLAYKEFGCQEVMWDAEGKDVDAHVVRKLLSRYPTYFKKHQLGKDVYLTYRLPNPRLEKAERKVLMETLDHIPVSNDVAVEFYRKDDASPIFEAIVPFTQNAEDLIAVARYYELAVAGRGNVKLTEDLTVSDWLGEVRPKRINVIPLFEDKAGLLSAGDIIEAYSKTVNPDYLRVFVGRSDPAMSYGVVAATLMAKIAISSMKSAGKRMGKPVYPMLGVGSLPFRGWMSPLSYKSVLEEFPGVNTFTIQSAFKYDYEEATAREAISHINSSNPVEGEEISPADRQKLTSIAEKFSRRYEQEVRALSPLVNALSVFLPPRRARKPHMGPFGYGRHSGRSLLPRAIVFTATLYTVGFPPEFMGLGALSTLAGEEEEMLRKYFKTMNRLLSAAANFFSWDSYGTLKEEGVAGIKLQPPLVESLEGDVKEAEEAGIDLGPKDYYGMKHGLFSFMSVMSLNQGRREEARNHIMEAAKVRRSLG